MSALDHARTFYRGTRRLRAAFSVLAFLSVLFSSQMLSGQLNSLVTSPQKPSTAAETTADPLGRNTPRGTVMGFLRQARRGDFATATQYLQPTPGKKIDLEASAKELQELTNLHFQGGLDFINDTPEGRADDALPLDRERAGVFVVGNSHVNLILVRVEDGPNKKIWLISKETIAESHFLYSEMRPSMVATHLPKMLTDNFFLSISAAQWIGWLLSLPASYYASWLVAQIFRLIFFGIIKLYRKKEAPAFYEFQAPLRLLSFALLQGIFVYLLKIPLFYRWLYARFLLGLLAAGIVWLLSRGVVVFFERTIRTEGSWAAQRGSMLMLVSRIIRVLLVIIGVLAVASALGFDTKAMLAGVGIGGLAIALAGQKTLENVIGGASLLLDRAVHVGDTCRINDRLGTVEDIGLRSLRLRMVDQTVLVVPNGLLAQVQFENLTSRTKLLIQDAFTVRMETTVENLQETLRLIKEIMDSTSYIERSTSRIRISRFAGAAIEVELFAYVLTGDWQEFTALREELMLNILEYLQAAGIRLAGPTQLNYVDRTSLASHNAGAQESLREPASHASAPVRTRTAGK